ncbi:MAG: hypothetical protein Q4F67_12335 [Propionibacteriaceae bacterium]|nr:hypothetical protein [Propionibacteriaceae bacterium]
MSHELAACRTDPVLHESRRRGEKDRQWRTRLVAARLVCSTCPVYAACLALLDDCRAGRVRVDGIVAGQPVTDRVYEEEKA